ncbi:lipopolysaccharide biosynthesis protein [Streptomyces sp. RFCAC02]|uniref:lipopolysaccharide biosynthesis protein n=1 Tax=Streptomyces sp. RFCAC02 TaxID=2499143 RepID=UPI0010221461|nr:lipopolysaccharide biosynthesis protein [Streptomyces sp. RFCAC02]
MSQRVVRVVARVRPGRRLRRRLARLRSWFRRGFRAWPRVRLRSLSRPWLPPLAGMALGALLGCGCAALTDHAYAADAYVVVAAADDADRAAAVGLAQAYGRLVTSGDVLRTAHTDAGVDTATLRDRVTAATSPDAPVIGITGRAPDAQDAARAANAVARALVARTDAADEATGTSLVQVLEAVPPADPVTPRGLLSAAVGGCAGAVAGLLLPLARPGGGTGRGPGRTGQPPVPAQPDPQERAGATV